MLFVPINVTSFPVFLRVSVSSSDVKVLVTNTFLFPRSMSTFETLSEKTTLLKITAVTIIQL